MAAPDVIETPPVKPHQPVWPLAEMYPYQGEWSENEYMRLKGGRPIEFADGFLEFPPTPTIAHQRIAAFLFILFQTFLAPRGGEVLFAPVRVRTKPRHFREPDLVGLLEGPQARMDARHLDHADFVVEIVSEDDPERDYVTKREEYAAAGVREYWIVDPTRRAILVLGLEGSAYREIGTFTEADTAQSRLLPGLSVKVAEVFAAANR